MDPNLRPIAGGKSLPENPQSIRMNADRVLVRRPAEGERTSKGGLLIPATAASVNKRCVWGEVVAVGPNVRNIEPGDQRLGDLRAEIWRVMALGQRLHPPDFDRPSKCESWTVSDVFAHLAGDYERYRDWLLAAIAGDVEPPFSRGELAADNEMLLERFAGMSGQQRLESFEEAANAYLAELATVEPELPQGNPLGTMTVGEQVVWATVECAIHGWDVAAALGIEWPPPSSLERMTQTWRERRSEPLGDGDPWEEILLASGRLPA